MLKIQKRTNDIYLTRGDSATISLEITDLNNKKYHFKDGTVTEIIFTIKRHLRDKKPVIQKTIINSLDFVFSADDTKNLRCGDYYYDVELRNNDYVFTIVPAALFVLTAEVTREDDREECGECKNTQF